MATPAFELAWVSERCLRVRLAGGCDAPTSARVQAVRGALTAARLPGLADLTPAYASLLLTFRLDGLKAPDVERRVATIVERAQAAPTAPPARLVEIPTCYEGACAPDLAEVAALRGLPTPEVVRLHAAPEYVVAFLGFSPGFPYLLGLDARLSTPRLQRPRPRVEPGSVAIAGGQAGIYPSATPGGWRLLGRTPLRLFDPSRPHPALLAPGDRVRFRPIGHAEHAVLSAETP